MSYKGHKGFESGFELSIGAYSPKDRKTWAAPGKVAGSGRA